MVLTIPALLHLFPLKSLGLLPSAYRERPSSSTSASPSIIPQMGHHHHSYHEIKNYWKGFQKVIISILYLKTGSCLSLPMNILESSSDGSSSDCLFQDCSVLPRGSFLPIIWHKTHYFDLNKLYLLLGWSTVLFCSPSVPSSTCQGCRAQMSSLCIEDCYALL